MVDYRGCMKLSKNMFGAINSTYVTPAIGIFSDHAIINNKDALTAICDQ